MSSHPPNSSEELIPTWCEKKIWPPLVLGNRVKIGEAIISREIQYLTPEEHREEIKRQEQQAQGQGQGSQEWGAATPGLVAESSADDWSGGMWDDGNMREDGEDDGGDGDARMEMDYPTTLRAPTPFSGFDDDDNTNAQQWQTDEHGTEQPVSPVSALGATHDSQQLSASTAADMTRSPEGDREERGRRRQRRVIGPPVEGRRKSSRKRTKTKRMVEEGG